MVGKLINKPSILDAILLIAISYDCTDKTASRIG